MQTLTRPSRLAVAAVMILALAIPLLRPGEAHAAESLSVNLASVTGAAHSVGEGFLYGVSQDGTQPSDQFLSPLGLTGYRGGGHASRDGSGTATRTVPAPGPMSQVIAQAKRLTASPYNAQYQAILSRPLRHDGSQPSNTMWPCASGNCSNWVTFIDSVVGALKASGVTVPTTSGTSRTSRSSGRRG